jgi:hypothetical protein
VFLHLAQKPRYAPLVLAQELGVACFGLAASLPRTPEPRAPQLRVCRATTRLRHSLQRLPHALSSRAHASTPAAQRQPLPLPARARARSARYCSRCLRPRCPAPALQLLPALLTSTRLCRRPCTPLVHHRFRSPNRCTAPRAWPPVCLPCALVLAGPRRSSSAWAAALQRLLQPPPRSGLHCAPRTPGRRPALSVEPRPCAWTRPPEPSLARPLQRAPFWRHSPSHRQLTRP